jgi:hypothetical protein
VQSGLQADQSDAADERVELLAALIERSSSLSDLLAREAA